LVTGVGEEEAFEQLEMMVDDSVEIARSRQRKYVADH